MSHDLTFVSVQSLLVLRHVANKGKVRSLNAQYEYWVFANNFVYRIEFFMSMVFIRRIIDGGLHVFPVNNIGTMCVFNEE